MTEKYISVEEFFLKTLKILPSMKYKTELNKKSYFTCITEILKNENFYFLSPKRFVCISMLTLFWEFFKCKNNLQNSFKIKNIILLNWKIYSYASD